MNIYEEWGLRPVINGSGKMTVLGASAVSAETARVMAAAAGDYVEIAALMKTAGTVIAGVTQAEDGCPTAGAAAGIAIATAAVIAGTSLSKIEALPDSRGCRNEIILQKGHAVHFGAAVTQMVRLGGGICREVGQANLVAADHIREAINDQTAALLYVKSHHAVQKGMVSLPAMAAIAKEHGLPLLVDAAAEEDLRGYAAVADLVIYSGGKAVGGPTSGFICGKRPLIEACRCQYQGIGRAMKVGKENIMGLMSALQQYGQQADTASEQQAAMTELLTALADVPGLSGRIVQDEAGRAIFRAEISVLPELAGLTAADLVAELAAGHPAIHTRHYYTAQGRFSIDPRPLLPGQTTTIAAAIRRIVRARQKEETNE